MNERQRNSEIEGYLLQIKKIGNSLGLILPKELARASQAEAKATSFMSSSRPSAAFKLSPYDPKHREGDGARAPHHSDEYRRHAIRRWRNEASRNGSISTSFLISMPNNWRCSAAPTEFAIADLLRIRAGAAAQQVGLWRKRTCRACRGLCDSASRRITRSSTATSVLRWLSMIVFLGLNGLDLDAPQDAGDGNDPQLWLPAKSAKTCSRAGSPITLCRLECAWHSPP